MIKNFKNLKKACDIEIQEIVQKIKDNTMYIAFDIFIKEFEKKYN